MNRASKVPDIAAMPARKGGKCTVSAITLCFLILASLLPSCRFPSKPDVMSRVTFVMMPPEGIVPAEVSYRIRYMNHNTRVTTTRGSVADAHYEDELFRGLYTVNVDGVIVLDNGKSIRVRGSVSDRLFLEPETECRIELLRLP